MSQEKYLEQLSSHSRYIVKQLPVIKTLKHNDNLNSNRRSYTWALFGRLILQFFHGFTVRYFSFPFIYEKLVNSLPPNVTLYSQSNSKNKRENHLYKLKAPSAWYFQITMNIVMQLSFYGSTKEIKLWISIPFHNDKYKQQRSNPCSKAITSNQIIKNSNTDHYGLSVRLHLNSSADATSSSVQS